MDSSTLNGATYKSSWKALPIDGSENAWAEELNVPRISIPRALEMLEEDAKSNEQSLYCQIKQPKSRKFVEENGTDTHPTRFYWETKPLISAIVRAKKVCLSKNDAKNSEKDASKGSGNVSKQDTFFERIFHILASDLSKRDLSADQFAQVQLIGNSKVREHMVQLFQNEVALRLNAVNWLTSHKLAVDSTGSNYTETAIVENILIICQSIDTLIDRLLYSQYTDQPAVSSITTEDISTLYEDLVAERKRITTHGEAGEDIITAPSLPDTTKNREIIEQLDRAFAIASQSSKNNPLSPKAQAQVETAFNSYLLATVPAEKREQVKRFSSSYSSLKRFSQHQHTFEEYESTVRQILITYVKGIFEDAAQGNLYPYAYNPYHSQSLDSMFLGENIKNVQQHISYRIHIALQCLCKINILEQYGTAPTEQGLSSLSSQIWTAIKDLANEYPHLPLGTCPENFPFEGFAQYYNQTVVPMLEEPLLTFNGHEDFSLKHTLLYVCKLIAVYEVDQSITEIQGNYEVLTAFYNKIQS